MGLPDISAEVKADLTKVAGDIYSDGASATMKEISKIGVDAVKVVRLALAPIQFLAAGQDRLSFFIDRAIRGIEPDKRISPMPSIALPLMEKLRYQDDGDVLTDIYINLLSRTFDADRFGEAHPAFLNIISQLSTDEAILLNEFSGKKFQVIFKNYSSSTSKQLAAKFVEGAVDDEHRNWIAEHILNAEVLTQIKYLPVYLEHLVSLGLLTYTNDYHDELVRRFPKTEYSYGRHYWSLNISKFGALFHSACVRDSLEAGLAASSSDRI